MLWLGVEAPAITPIFSNCLTKFKSISSIFSANITFLQFLDEISYNNRKFILAAECDLEKDKLKEENYIVAEVKIEDTDLVASTIEDEVLAQNITKMLIEKVRKN